LDKIKRTRRTQAARSGLRITYRIVVGILAVTALLMFGYLGMSVFDGLRILAGY